MAVDKKGQIYFTFEEINEKAERLNRHMDYLRQKSHENDLRLIGAEVWGETMLRCLNRTNRISKAKTKVFSDMKDLLNEAMLKAWSM